MTFVSMVPVLTTVLLIASPAHSEMLPLNEARENRLGGIVTQSKTGEEIYVGCVEKNPAGDCIQFRLISQLGKHARVLGNQPIEPFEVVNRKIFQPRPFFDDTPAVVALNWIGEGFQKYKRNGMKEGFNALVTSYIPVVGIPGIGIAVIAGSAAFDLARLTILLPIETVRKLLGDLPVKKLNRAFTSLFNPRLSQSSQTVDLRPAKFAELVKHLEALSSAS